MRAFDLRAELRESADADHTPAPVDLPAAGDPDLAADLAAARAELRTARLALARGDRDAAAEACARARVRAPELPEALELEAIIAHARGDDARARTLYQQWLDGGPDDPPGEDRARALLSR
jgi:Flp pilus assembly protein TadD